MAPHSSTPRSEKTGYTWVNFPPTTGESVWRDIKVYQNTGSATFWGQHHPLNPTFAGYFAEAEAPLSDAECAIYNGPDSDYTGHEICFIGSDDNASIGDITYENNPTMIASFTYPGLVRAHQGVLTSEQRYWLLSDTMDEVNNVHNTRTYLIDVADLDNPSLLEHYEHATTARDNHVYINGDTAYHSYWKAGLNIFDRGDLPATSFDETGFLDSAPTSDSISSAGAWSNYTWWRNGIISVSNTDEGLLLVWEKLSLTYGTFLDGE